MLKFFGIGRRSQLDELETFLDRFLKPLIAAGGPSFVFGEALTGAAFLCQIKHRLTDPDLKVAERIKDAMREATNLGYAPAQDHVSANDDESLKRFIQENGARVPRLNLRKLLVWMRFPDDAAAELLSSCMDDGEPHAKELEQCLIRLLEDVRPGWLRSPLTASAISGGRPSVAYDPSSLAASATMESAKDLESSASATASHPPPSKAAIDSPVVFTVKPPITVEWPKERWQGIADRVKQLRQLGGNELERANRRVEEMQTLLESGAVIMAFVGKPLGHTDKFVVAGPVPDNVDVWFIGDIHCDLLALEGILAYIKETSGHTGRDAWIVFLGDLFDDGDGGDGDLVVRRVVEEMLARPGKVAVIAGNHDESLRFDDVEKKFISTVTPAEFCEWLNAENRRSRLLVGATIIKLIELSPRAILLDDGLLIAHGGVPHSDLQQSFANDPNFLNDDKCLQDFVWTRAHDTAKRRIPNRSSKGCSFGIEDFDGFCDSASRLLGKPIRRMVRGHDHVEERYKVHEHYKKHPLLTINAMSYRKRDMFGPYVRVPCVARWIRDELPQVHRLTIPEEIVKDIYPEPTEGASAEG